MLKSLQLQNENVFSVVLEDDNSSAFLVKFRMWFQNAGVE